MALVSGRAVARTPTVCVERKSVPDLYQSFNSGRLFHQIEAISRHYSQPDAGGPLSKTSAPSPVLAPLHW